ncbi:MAG: N-ethylammeline chlorohydrolase [Methylotenera sp.]|nr:MAG: N-ethylammeline chlorohydrolase [Methylotenera sp.]
MSTIDPLSNPQINADVIIESRWLASMAPSNALLENHAVIVQKGLIAEILPISDARKKYTASSLVCLDEHILIPGLINLHTHAAMGMMRGMADDLPLMAWLNNHIWPAEKVVLSPQYVKDATLLACAEMLASGTTCFNDMYFYPEATALAAGEAGIRANLGLVVLDFPTAYATDADDYLQKGFNAHDSWRSNPLITSSIAPHAPYTVSDQTFEKVVIYAEQLSVGIHTHLHETRQEITQSEAQFGIRPIQRMANLGLLGPNLVAAHCVHLLENEMELLAEYGCHVAHCASSNLKLASGIAPVAALLAKGVNVGLGTDSVASNNRLDMLSEMRLSALLAKGFSEDATAVPAYQALQMATINAAKAMGMDNKIGSIEVGKFADLTAVRLGDLETLPYYDPIAHLVYSCGREQVSHTWVAGELRYSNGVFTNIEPTELKEIIQTWQPKLRQYKN